MDLTVFHAGGRIPFLRMLESIWQSVVGMVFQIAATIGHAILSATGADVTEVFRRAPTRSDGVTVENG